MKVETSKMVGFGVGALMTTGALTGLWARMDLDDAQHLHEAQEYLVAAKSDSEEANHNALRLEQQLGESCVSALNFYLPDQVLSDTDEEVVIRDVLALPSKPCGDTPTEARVAIRSLRVAVSSKFSSESDILFQENVVSIQQDEYDDKQWSNRLVTSAIIAPLAGLAIAWFNGRSKKYTGKSRLKAYSDYFG